MSAGMSFGGFGQMPAAQSTAALGTRYQLNTVFSTCLVDSC